jgi:hypothetical protein
MVLCLASKLALGVFNLHGLYIGMERDYFRVDLLPIVFH